MTRSVINGETEKMRKVTFRCFETELADYFIQLGRQENYKRRRYTLSDWIRDTLNRACTDGFFDTPQRRQDAIDDSFDLVKALAESASPKGVKHGKK